MPRQNPEKAVPSFTLEESVAICTLIKDNNAGRPIDKITLAEWIGYSPQSGAYPRRLAAAKLYHLIEVAGDTVSLADLGERLMYPESEPERVSALEEAARSPQILSKLYDHYNGNEVPNAEIAYNVLRRTYKIDDKKVEKLWSVFVGDAEYLGVIHTVKGKRYLNLSRLRYDATSEEQDEGDTRVSASEEREKAESAPVEADAAQSRQPGQSNAVDSRLGTVFVSHGKNKKILEQIQTTLELGGFHPRIAIHEETAAVPVPDKVFDAMHECAAAIINLSADEIVTTSDGDESYRINENVLIEIGAAFVLYRKRVILVADTRVKIPSNLQGLYLCTYEGDSLDWEAGMKLQKALLSFKKE